MAAAMTATYVSTPMSSTVPTTMPATTVTTTTVTTATVTTAATSQGHRRPQRERRQQHPEFEKSRPHRFVPSKKSLHRRLKHSTKSS